MDENTLTCNISSLFKISRAIYNVYQKLYQLELDGKINTKEYAKELDKLRIAREQEKNVINRIEYDDCNRVFEVLAKTGFLRKGDTDFIVLFKNNPKLKVGFRMYSNLATKLSLSNQYIENSISPDVVDEIYYSGIVSSKEELYKQIKNDVEMKSGLNHHFLEKLILYWQKIIDKSQYEEFRSGLLKKKYDYLYLSPFFEATILANDFVIKRLGILNTDLLKEIINMDERTYQTYLNEFGYRIASLSIGELLPLSCESITKSKMIKGIIEQLFIRVGISMMNERTVSEVITERDRIVSSQQFRKVHPHSKLGNILVEECFTKKI